MAQPPSPDGRRRAKLDSDGGKTMTPQADRIASLDVLRGLGILGILAVNAPFFAQPFALQFEPLLLGPMDADSQQAWAVVHTFFERKFVTLFSMLFGASILLVGGEKDDKERGAVLNRRLAWLALFGLLHGALVWYGDILLNYAVAGFIAAQFRSLKPGKLFAIGAVLFGVFALVEVASYWALALMPEAASQGMAFVSPEAARADLAAFGGSFQDSLIANFNAWLLVIGYTVFYVPATVGLMFIGMGLYRTGVFTARSSVWLYLLLLALAAAAFAGLGWAVCQEVQSGLKDPFDQALRSTINGFLAPVMSLGYVALFCLIVKSPLRGLTLPLARTGQMAFTNYLTQSLIMTGIYYGGRGLGLFGEHTLAEQVPIVLGIWALQLVWSPLWLSMFRYGPFEWVWRSLSFGRLMPMRR